MRPQSSVFLRALYLLLCMASVFWGESASQNTTNVTARTTEYNTSATESPSPTTTPPTTTTIITKAHGTFITGTTSSETSSPATVQSDTTPTPMTSSSDAGTAVCLILFFCFLIALSICAYKWYIHQGRPSFAEIQRSIAESVRNTWAAAMGHLRQSSKEEEEDEEMEAGITQAEEQKKQGEDAEDEDDDDDDDDDDDSSGDYSRMDGTVMTKKPKKDEEEDGQNNERDDDDMTSVELKDEQMEREKDDLTVL